MLISKSDKPLVTLDLLAYNQERFLKEGIEGVLSQTYSPLEIILSKDWSSDRTFATISELRNGYKRPEKIDSFRDSERLILGDAREVFSLSKSFHDFFYGNRIN